MRRLLAFVDVETTGLDCAKHRVIELAVMLVDGKTEWTCAKPSVFRFRPSPTDLDLADPVSLKVNGYEPGHPDWAGAPECGSPEAKDQWDTISGMLLDASLIGHNVLFDRGFLWQELIRHGVRNRKTRCEFSLADRESNDGPWTRRFVDTQAFAYALALTRDLPSWGLQAAYEALGGPPLPAHRAEADVLKTLWLYRYGVRDTPHDHLGRVDAACERLVGVRPGR